MGGRRVHDQSGGNGQGSAGDRGTARVRVRPGGAERDPPLEIQPEAREGGRRGAGGYPGPTTLRTAAGQPMRRRAVWVACLELILSLLAPLAAPANAVEDEPIDLQALELERTKRAALYPVRRRISRYLEAATKAVDQGKPEEGRALLARLEPKRLNPYERALVYRLEAHLAYFASDYKAAREHFEKVLAEEALPVRDDNRVRFNIAQLHAAAQEWREALAALDRWSRYVPEPDPLAFFLRAVAYYQLDELDAALVNAKHALDLSPEPLEGWLGLQAAPS